MIPRTTISQLLTIFTVIMGSNLASGEEIDSWTQWRGPSRNGHVRESASWPDHLDEKSLTLAWRVPLSPSYSGPIVSKDLVFVTETRDEKYEAVRALDRATGKQVWETSWEGAIKVPFFAKANGDWIRSTPAYDGESLYVGGIRDVLVCLDAKTGKTNWTVDFVKDMKSEVPTFGFVCSPLIDGDDLYVQAGGGFCKLDKRTGKLIWKTLDDGGGMYGSAFSSPYMAELLGKRQLLVQTREKLCGVDPENGDVLWSRAIPTFRGMNILTPTVVGDTVFTSAYRGKSFLFKLTNEGGKYDLSELWTNKVSGYMSSPVVVGGYLYLHLQNQRFICIEVSSGKTMWTTAPFGKYWSLVANKDRILALDETGELLLIRATPEKFDLIDSRKISEEPTWAHLAVVGDELFIRELNAMAVYQWKDLPSTNSPTASVE